MAEPQFVADNRFQITCGHCGAKFWMFDLLSVKLCRNCFLLGHRGNGGTCWKCRSDYYSDDEPFAAHGDD